MTKKTAPPRPRRRTDLRPEYRFNYSVSRPNRFAAHFAAGAEAVKPDATVPEGV